VNRDFIGALLQLNAEKNISRESLVRTVAESVQAAYRRVAPGNENVWVDVDPETGHIRAYRAMQVVDEIEDEFTEWDLETARKRKPEAQVGELIEIEELPSSSFGRIHAQVAKQLVLQRLREVEREQVFGQYAQRENEIITGTVSRVEPRGVILDVGRAEAVLPTTDQSSTEHYRLGQHVKAYVLEVRRTTKGPLIYVSRTHKSFLRRLFELEVPEIHAGTVEIKAIAREAGSRSKVGVASRQEGLDPVGATVGQRGGRVQAVVAELGGEKIDIIPWHEDPAVFVANALSPAQVVGVSIDEEARIATVTVPERMLSLAIGREGQNARLAAKLTGWRIDIRSDQPKPVEAPAAPAPADEAAAAGEAAPAEETAPAAAAKQPVAEETAPAAQAQQQVAAAEETAPAAEETAPAAKPARKRTTKAAAKEAKPGAPSAAAEPAASESEPAAPAAGEAAPKGAKPAAPAAEETAAPAKPARKRTTKATAKADIASTSEVEPVTESGDGDGAAAKKPRATRARSKAAVGADGEAAK
jgi:transcription termination/antitermination protein NusA